jgi:hypothetical protein
MPIAECPGRQQILRRDIARLVRDGQARNAPLNGRVPPAMPRASGVVAIAALMLTGCSSSSSKRFVSTSSEPNAGPLERLSKQTSQRLFAATQRISGLAEQARKAKLRALVARYDGTSDEVVRAEVLKEIASADPEVVQRGPFAEPTSLDRGRLQTSLAGAPEGSVSFNAASAVTEILTAARGATFQTLVSTSPGSPGLLGRSETVPQVLDVAVQGLTQAGLSGEVARLRSFERSLPPAPEATRSAYATEIEHIAHMTNAAVASAVKAGSTRGSSYGQRISALALKLEQSPKPTYASDVASAPLAGELQAVAVSASVVAIEPSRLQELSQQIEATDATVAKVLRVLGTGPAAAHHTAYSGRPVPLQPPEPPGSTTSTTSTTSSTQPRESTKRAVEEVLRERELTREAAEQERQRLREEGRHKYEAEEQHNGEEACNQAEAERKHNIEHGTAEPEEEREVAEHFCQAHGL